MLLSFGRRPAQSWARFLALSPWFVVALTGCDRPPSSSAAREWTPADHDKPKPSEGQTAPSVPGPDDGETLGALAWASQCASCHGPRGRGDGPQGPMVRAPDLSRSDWQGSVKDADIENTIRSGRGRMPKFDLPAEVLTALVREVRSFSAR
jgi:mono/diheme cytochrome c family protein